MNTNTFRGSAEIIPFPIRARVPAAEPREMETAVTKFLLPRTAKVAFGGAWYHEAAIEEAAARKK
jgi:hypothetical protein